MATTVHIPRTLLERIDARAKALNVSRNRLVVASLRRTLEAEEEWSPEFLRALDRLSEEDEVSRAVDEMLRAIRAHRRSRRRKPL